MTKTTQPAREPAIVFADRLYPGDWRVEWMNDEGGIEVAIFAGPNARERAFRYADRQSIGADGWAMTPSGMRGNRSLPGRRGDSRARSWLDGASMDGLFQVGEDEPMPLVAATHHKAP